MVLIYFIYKYRYIMNKNWRKHSKSPLFEKFTNIRFGRWVTHDYIRKFYINDKRFWNEYREFMEVNAIYNEVFMDFEITKKHCDITGLDTIWGYQVTYNTLLGNSITIKNNKLIYKKSSTTNVYSLNSIELKEFTALFNKIINSKYDEGVNELRNTTTHISIPTNKQKLYTKLKENIKVRERQLSEGRYNKNEIESLKNELSVSKIKLKEMETKYNV